jgi:flagellar operon protein
MTMVVDSSGNALNRPIITGKPLVTGGKGVNSLNTNKSTRTDEFAAILKQKQVEQEEIKFSRHAEFRLQSRNISLSQTQKDKMKEAVSKAESKGVRDSLVLMDDLAFVVNVKNRTVITAANSNELKENVFTNIDGAVII